MMATTGKPKAGRQRQPQQKSSRETPAAMESSDLHSLPKEIHHRRRLQPPGSQVCCRLVVEAVAGIVDLQPLALT